MGYVPFNTAAALRLPPVRQQLAARIMTEADTLRMLALEPSRCNRALLFLLYGAGLRATEAAELRWADLAAREDPGRDGHGKGARPGRRCCRRAFRRSSRATWPGRAG